MPYYLAINPNEVELEQVPTEHRAFILLPSASFEQPFEQTPEISFTDSRLRVTGGAHLADAKNTPIYACAKPSTVLYAATIWLETAQCGRVLAVAPLLVTNKRLNDLIGTFLRNYVHTNLFRESQLQPSAQFLIDQPSYRHLIRRWTINANSPAGWKKVFISNVTESGNFLVNLAKRIIEAPAHAQPETVYGQPLGESNVEIAESKKTFENSLEQYLRVMSLKSMKPYHEQFITWMRGQYEKLSPVVADRVFNFCISKLGDGVSDAPQPVPTARKNDIERISPVEMSRDEQNHYIFLLEVLWACDFDYLFIETMCAFLTCDRYLFLLKETALMGRLTSMMHKHPGFISLIKYAMGFAMYYVTYMEFVGLRGGHYHDAPHIFTHAQVREFPRFNDPAPYVPVGVRKIANNTPFHIPGDREPVAVADIPARLNTSFVRDDAKFDVAKDIPWREMSLNLTGSRYANACWIAPRERDMYGGNYANYVREYIGDSSIAIDRLFEVLGKDADAEPTIDVLGPTYGELPSDPIERAFPDASPTAAATSGENPANAVSAHDTKHDESDAESDEEEKHSVCGRRRRRVMIPKPVVAVPGPSLSPVRKWKPKNPNSDRWKATIGHGADDQPETDMKRSEEKTIESDDEKEEILKGVNLAARDLVMNLKHPSELFGAHTDIDICWVGDHAEYDKAAGAFVTHLRKFGRAVAMRYQKKGKYTWMIITSFLRYSIDFFHRGDSALTLISTYMTSYPRAYFDGIKHWCTADYVCARMSGINNRYIYTMNDPIYTMMKSARREDITILLNLTEQAMLRKWLEVYMPNVKLAIGNVSPTHSFFGTNALTLKEPKHDDIQRAWIEIPTVFPRSRVPLAFRTFENADLVKDSRDVIRVVPGKKIQPANPTIFAEYSAQVKLIASETARRNIPLNMSATVARVATELTS